LEVRAALVYSGIHLVSEDRIRLFEALRHRFSPDSDYFAFQRYNLTSVHGWLTGEDEGAGVDVVDITLHHPGQLSAPFETYYGLMSLADVATLYTTHGKTLVAANIRNYKGSTLAEAICKLEGFIYAPSDTVYWQQGYSTERDFIYVPTQHLSHNQLQQLSDDVGEHRSLLVVCTAFRAKADRYPNLTIKKIPQAVLSRCEWDHDDYSLQVENLPKAPPKPGQMQLAFSSEEDR